MAHDSREHRRRRLRRHGRRAYVRSVYFLPSMATLGNAICGFAAIYIAGLDKTPAAPSPDPLTDYFTKYNFVAAAYMIFVAMLFVPQTRTFPLTFKVDGQFETPVANGKSKTETHFRKGEIWVRRGGAVASVHRVWSYLA